MSESEMLVPVMREVQGSLWELAERIDLRRKTPANWSQGHLAKLDQWRKNIVDFQVILRDIEESAQ